MHANAYGAALVGGPDHRTAFDLPDVRVEAGLVVVRGAGREVSYAYLPGERAIMSSPWEGHCYPPKFQALQKTAWEGFVAGQRSSRE